MTKPPTQNELRIYFYISYFYFVLCSFVAERGVFILSKPSKYPNTHTYTSSSLHNKQNNAKEYIYELSHNALLFQSKEGESEKNSEAYRSEMK